MLHAHVVPTSIHVYSSNYKFKLRGKWELNVHLYNALRRKLVPENQSLHCVRGAAYTSSHFDR